ncbi:MAG: hypothetical protein IH795_00395 [Bacteroidetes bacterium]|nr:hypothetical protein [Bacteroidota bacterium]
MHCHKCGVLLDGYDEEQEFSGKVFCVRDTLYGKTYPSEEESFEEEY